MTRFLLFPSLICVAFSLSPVFRHSGFLPISFPQTSNLFPTPGLCAHMVHILSPQTCQLVPTLGHTLPATWIDFSYHCLVTRVAPILQGSPLRKPSLEPTVEHLTVFTLHFMCSFCILFAFYLF